MYVDAFGRELRVGDIVAYPIGGSTGWGQNLGVLTELYTRTKYSRKELKFKVITVREIYQYGTPNYINLPKIVDTYKQSLTDPNRMVIVTNADLPANPINNRLRELSNELLQA